MSREIPDVLDQDEQERLLRQFNLRYITPHRNRTMIMLLLSTGLRLAEITNLKWRDINLNSGQVKVLEDKGLKYRILYIDDHMLEELRQWKERQFEFWGVTDYVFTTRNLRRLNGSEVRKMIITYTKKAGIDKHITTHSLRHTFATDLLRECENIKTVQKILGHSNLSTTQIYNHIVNQ